METRSEWSRQVAARVGELVAYYRTRQAVFTAPDLEQRVIPPMTLQELSDRCAELGYPIARSVLSKLEKGHRQSVTLDEVLVLSAALHVPPALLMFPLGRSQTTDPLPGYRVHPFDAIRWLTGELPLTSDGPDYSGRDQPLTLYSVHQYEVERWPGRERDLAAASKALTSSKTPGERRGAQVWLEGLREMRGLKSVRSAMRQLGYLPPPLPPDIARALGEEVPDGKHREAT